MNLLNWFSSAANEEPRPRTHATIIEPLTEMKEDLLEYVEEQKHLAVRINTRIDILEAERTVALEEVVKSVTTVRNITNLIGESDREAPVVTSAETKA